MLRPFLCLHITTTVLIVCWLAFLTLSPQQQSAMSEDLIRQLKRSQDVREGRQLTSGGSETILEGDILIRNTGTLDPSALDAHLADPNRLWPSGLVEYKFYKSFPASSHKTVKRAMTYITTRVPCITFEEATSSTVDYVLFRDGLRCNSELGRTGGEQVINLNRGCFSDGLMTTVHELLHTLGFVHKHTRPDRDNFISINEENIEEGREGNFRKRVLGYSDFFERDSVNTRNSPYDVLSLLHYGPRDFSKNGEDVFTFLHDLPDETWPEPDHGDPLSIVDEVSMLMITDVKEKFH